MPGNAVELLHSAISQINTMVSDITDTDRWSRLTNFVFLPFVLHRREWTPRRYQGFTFRPLVDIFWVCFVQSRRIA